MTTYQAAHEQLLLNRYAQRIDILARRIIAPAVPADVPSLSTAYHRLTEFTGLTNDLAHEALERSARGGRDFDRVVDAYASGVSTVGAAAHLYSEAYAAHGHLLYYRHLQGTWLDEARSDAFTVIQARMESAADELTTASSDLRRVADDLDFPPGVRAVALSRSTQATRTTTSTPEPVRAAPYPQPGARHAR